MWKKAELKSALKKAESDMKTKEETKQGATFTQVVQKSLISTTPSSGNLPETAPNPKFFRLYNCSVSAFTNRTLI